MPSKLPEPLRVVAIGGGTGLSTLLKGLKDYAVPQAGIPAVEITAIVTVTDDGGSSGRLRREFDILPPGDIRNCMVALSEDEALLSRLFQYRFNNGRGLKGHSFGNLFLTALAHLTGDFARAVQVSSEVLASYGHIYPSTRRDVSLRAHLASGAVVSGETRISRSREPIERIELAPKRCKPLPEALEAIARADVITFGPGSLFTSVVPNVLVEGIPKAIQASKAIKAYFVNLMWQPGETINYTASEHVRMIEKHAGRNLIEYAIINTGAISPRMRRRYLTEKVQAVHNDVGGLESMGLRIIAAPLLAKSDKVRHDPHAIAAIAVELAAAARERSRSKLGPRRALRGHTAAV